MQMLHRATTIFLAISLILLGLIPYTSQACKDIVAIGDATAGEYNLMLKVRDPSRPGLQTLTIVPSTYTYTYHHPWTGKTLEFTTTHKYIGVVTAGDSYPHTIKPGMALSTAGICYGDADSNSNWINPSRYAWDDFDWIRYTCEQANTVDEAILLMTKDVVDELHAPGVSENLFIVGPKKAALIEADAYQYTIDEFTDGVAVMSNYPKQLWRSQIRKRLPIASSFDVTKEKTVRRGATVHLQGRYGVRISKIGEDYIIARQVPAVKITNRIPQFIGKQIRIPLGCRDTVGDYSVTLLDIQGRKAKVHVEYKFKAWEDTLVDIITPQYGSISLSDMITWSRLHQDDLNGLRPMCEAAYPYEAVIIYQIPAEHYETLSIGWFAPNHACASVYVPVHISVTDIFDPYENGKAAQLSLDLVETYGHNYLTTAFNRTEHVFFTEVHKINEIACRLLENNTDIAEFITSYDTGMQEQAWLTQQLWDTIAQSPVDLTLRENLKKIWDTNYHQTLLQLKKTVENLDKSGTHKQIIPQLIAIAESICTTTTMAARVVRLDVTTADQWYTTGRTLLKNKAYTEGFDYLIESYQESNITLNQLYHQNTLKDPDTINYQHLPWALLTGLLTIILLLLVIIGIIVFFIIKKP